MREMDVEDLKRLQQHLAVAIEMSEAGGLITMTQPEINAFKAQFGDADIVIGDFIIRMARGIEKKDLIV